MKPLRVLQVVLGVAIASSVVHYTDNFFRFDEYPQDEPELILQPMIPISWVFFVGAGLYGYRLFKQGRLKASAVWLGVFSISGLISPLHYTAEPPSHFDGLQNAFIWTDFLTCVAVVAFAVWAWRQARLDPAASTPAGAATRTARLR